MCYIRHISNGVRDLRFCEQNSEFYDLEYYLSLEYRCLSGAHFGYIKNFLKTIKTLNLKGKRVLDVGCGGGFFTQKIAESGAKVMGCDYSPFAVQFAKERYPHLKIVQNSAYEIDKLGIKGLDFIFALEVLEHMSRPEIFFEKALKLLNPKDGRLLLTTDNEDYLFKKVPFNRVHNFLMRTSSGGRAVRLIDKVERLRRRFKNYHQGHINLSSGELWAEKIKKAGFNIEKVIVFSSISIPLIDAFCGFIPLFSRGDHVLVIAKVLPKNYENFDASR